jgi:hypothetical protein
MRSIFSALLAAAITGAIGFSQPLAAAPVTPTFSVSPGSILPGDAATIDLSLLLLPDPGSSNAAFFSGSVDFNFGDGTATQTVSITPGGTFKEFDQLLHAYIDLGSYTVSYSAAGIFLADIAKESARAGCSRAAIARISNRFLRIHRRNFCRLHPTVSFVVRLPTLWAAHGSDSLTVEALATPLPTALPLFASGAAFLGWLARRRRNKASMA